MKREFVINRQGKEYVLYAGLLNEAHQQGLKAIRTQLLQAPTAENGHVAICFAEVTTERGTFTGIGDADQTNVNRAIANALIRMAETRAKARALRDAVNISAELLDEAAETAEAQDEPAAPAQPAKATAATAAPAQQQSLVEARRAEARELWRQLRRAGKEPPIPPAANAGAGEWTAYVQQLRQLLHPQPFGGNILIETR